MRSILFLIPFLAFWFAGAGQTSADVAVQLTATVQASPPQITLGWVPNTSTNQYQVYRKYKNDQSWGSAIATLPGSATQFVDTLVGTDTLYEYNVTRISNNYSGQGYICSGIELREVFHRGRLLLIVDSTMTVPLAFEIDRLITDMEGDGWDVVRKDVDRGGTVTHVKDLIVSEYYLDPINTKAVFLLGRVPVPYSGNINPDGHADHLGAWPADCYYGDVDGYWTDQFVNSTTASPPRTQNKPGDGKFDQSIVPSDLELQVGRVDMSGLPTFTLSETQLLKNYLDKDHEYRKKVFVALKQAVVDDNFGYFSGEAFAGSAYKNFSPLVGSANVQQADYIMSMTNASFQWSYGCGGGSYTSAGGIGTTANLAGSNLQGVFTMLFGSYFGDWDANNSFLKAPLAQGRILTNIWSGRPHYQLHHMGMGENIGYSVLSTQNNLGNVYFGTNIGVTGRWVHNALLGDPTLRHDIVAPVSNLVATRMGTDCHISWTAAAEPGLAGYNIYRKNDSSKVFVKLNAQPVSGTTYTDLCMSDPGVYTYMVRTLKLEVNNSGSYYNMSEGLADTALNTNDFYVVSYFNSQVSGDQVILSNYSQHATAYHWDYGDGQTSTQSDPVHTYSANGVYTVMLIAFKGCATDTSYEIVTVLEVSVREAGRLASLIVYPNPTDARIKLKSNSLEPLPARVYDSAGKLIWEGAVTTEVPIDLDQGLYLLMINYGNTVSSAKVLVTK